MKPKIKDKSLGFWKEGVIIRGEDLTPIIEKINELQDEIEDLKKK